MRRGRCCGTETSGLLALDWSPQWADSTCAPVRKGLHPGAEGTQRDLLLEHTAQPASSSAGLECLTVDEIGEGFLPRIAIITQFPGPVPVLALDYLPLSTFPPGPAVCVHCSLKVAEQKT